MVQKNIWWNFLEVLKSKILKFYRDQKLIYPYKYYILSFI